MKKIKFKSFTKVKQKEDEMNNNEKEIKGLNLIWVQKRLDPKFFTEKILPVMLANYEFDYSSTPADNCDLLVVTVRNPWYTAFLTHILKPAICLIVTENRNEISEKRGEEQERLKKIFKKLIKVPNRFITLSNKPIMKIEDVYNSQFKITLQKIEEELGVTFEGQHREVFVDTTNVPYSYARSILWAIRELTILTRGGNKKYIPRNFSINIYGMLSLDMPEDIFTGPTAGWIENKLVGLAPEKALGKEVISIEEYR